CSTDSRKPVEAPSCVRHNDYMLVTPLPGTSRDQLQKILQEQHWAVERVLSGHHDNAQAKLGGYLEWTATAVRHLHYKVTAADIDRLVLTPGYGRLLAMLGTVTGTDMATQRALNDLVSLELEQRKLAFEAARARLDSQIRHWSGLQGVF